MDRNGPKWTEMDRNGLKCTEQGIDKINLGKFQYFLQNLKKTFCTQDALFLDLNQMFPLKLGVLKNYLPAVPIIVLIDEAQC